MEFTGADIRHHREAHNLTQQQLADRLGVARRSAIGWETDKAHPQGRNRVKIERFLAQPATTDTPDAGPLLRDASLEQTIAHLAWLSANAAGTPTAHADPNPHNSNTAATTP